MVHPLFCPRLGVQNKKTTPKCSSGGSPVPSAGWGGSSDEAMARGSRLLRLGPSPRLSWGREDEKWVERGDQPPNPSLGEEAT